MKTSSLIWGGVDLSFILLAISALLMIVASIIGCSGPKISYTEEGIAYTEKQWTEFQECINAMPTDAVCDSCYKAIILRE